jgi:hypothetical protein
LFNKGHGFSQPAQADLFVDFSSHDLVLDTQGVFQIRQASLNAKYLFLAS